MQAKTDSDEVYAQIMLQPEADVSRLISSSSIIDIHSTKMFHFWAVFGDLGCELML
jgi:hypothetical protein